MSYQASVASRPLDTCSEPAPRYGDPGASPLGTFAPVGLSANGLHELAVQAFRIGNRGRLSLCEALRVLRETRLYYDLGFPSLAAYADTFFQLRRSETFEYVRVSKALVDLAALREAFGQGRIGWSALKAITRVASVESQASWIEFARQNGVERTLAEAQDALRTRRDAPRDSSFGLPNLDQKLVLRFSRSDIEKVRRWLETACATVAETTGVEEVTLEQALLFLCERAMASGGKEVIPGESAGRSARAQIVYQHCPECRRARVGTRDGFVEVTPEEVERYAGSAEQVVIDGPTPPKLRRRILARAAGRCGNPRCRHRADHCHHIIFRSRGGKTTLQNEVAVCSTCHALVHAGLLQVSGRADHELSWSPVACDRSLGGDVASGRAGADHLPLLRLVTPLAKQEATADGRKESANADSKPGSPIGTEKSAKEDSTPETVNRQDLALGLVRLGVPAARSRRLIDAAIMALPLDLISEAEVLRTAIRSI